MQSSNSRKLKLLASLNHLVKKSLPSSLFLLFLINKNSSFSSHALYNSSLSASILSKAGHSSVFKLLDVLDSNLLLLLTVFLPVSLSFLYTYSYPFLCPVYLPVVMVFIYYNFSITKVNLCRFGIWFVHVRNEYFDVFSFF